MANIATEFGEKIINKQNNNLKHIRDERSNSN